ncbi:MAG TPA: phosphotransferase [Albidovulum sp.]|uniref:aminoglycoside phosphotransferase family protein n=1 Tax=Albidovulum sp. TaxID=1872424 RepID=UPI002C134FA2|nr:phosphotransferase [Albidovulum sp.]
MSSPEPVAALIASAGWSGARAVPVAGDASARRFTRHLRADGSNAILMDASADPGGSSRRFADLSAWINAQGFSAPHVLAADLPAELLLVEDFGDRLFARLLAEDPTREAELYTATAEFLVAFQRVTPPSGLAPLDGPALANLTRLVIDWYLPGMDAPVTPEALGIPDLIARLYDDLAGAAPLVTSLRDFHAENVLWLPDRSGPARLGLIDFQDAVTAHPAYDLVSFLQDARRDLSPGTEAAVFDLFCREAGHDPGAFRAVYALIGAQRALRILGVFARLIRQAGKRRYAAFFPRVWGHLAANLTHPALAPLSRAIRATLPEPTPARIDRMIASCPTP